MKTLNRFRHNKMQPRGLHIYFIYYIIILFLTASMLFTGSVKVKADTKKTGVQTPDIQKTDAQPTDGQDDGDPSPGDGMSAARLFLDNENQYEGMDRSYSEGYIPRVENGMAYIVVPVLCSRPLRNKSLRVSLNLGDTQSMPFVCKNYEKTLHLKKTKVRGSSRVVEGYAAVFDLELKKDRYNGSYPVVLSFFGTDQAGMDVAQDFTVYVNITDGKPHVDGDGDDGGDGDDSVKLAPKVLVQSYQFSKKKIKAGEQGKVDITLVNKSKTEPVQNMTVVLKEQGEFFTLLDQSDSRYVDQIAAGEAVTVSYRYKVNPSTPQGSYNFEAVIDYNDDKGGAYNTQGTVKCRVVQPVKMQFDELNIPEQVEIADMLDVQVQAMNLGRGKVYNVRAVVEADGLLPDGTIFIGDIEAGQTGLGSTRIQVTGLRQSENIYGETNGEVTYYFQDESGKEHRETKEIMTSVMAMNIVNTEQEEDNPGQWWLIMAVLANVIVIMVIAVALRFRMYRRFADEAEETDEADGMDQTLSKKKKAGGQG